MLENYGGVNVRHGTDFHQFDGGETIQLDGLRRFGDTTHHLVNSSRM